MEDKTEIKESITEVKEVNDKDSNTESYLIDQIKELKEQMKERDAKIDELTKNIALINQPKDKEVEVLVESNISSVYKDLEIISKQAYTADEAETEFARRLELLRSHRGTPSEELV